jgi:hypothetical protein
MATSLYDMSVASYLQTLTGVSGFLAKGADYANENGIDLGEIVSTQLRPDMFPFHFQVVSVWHHSLNAIKGMQEGISTPPPDVGQLDYAGLQALVGEAVEGLQAYAPDEVNALAGKEVLFKFGEMELPFTAENYVMSFSLPNFYFHATTAYDILRMTGVPLGKMDFLGAVRLGAR